MKLRPISTTDEDHDPNGYAGRYDTHQHDYDVDRYIGVLQGCFRDDTAGWKHDGVYDVRIALKRIRFTQHPENNVTWHAKTWMRRQGDDQNDIIRTFFSYAMLTKDITHPKEERQKMPPVPPEEIGFGKKHFQVFPWKS